VLQYISSKSKALIPLSFLLLLLSAACDECDSVVPAPQSDSWFRLLDQAGNDLWFIPGFGYNPDKATAVITVDSLRIPVETSVVRARFSPNYVSFPLLPSVTDQNKATLFMNGIDSLVFYNRTVTDQENCQEFNEISFVLIGDTVVCSPCGIPVSEGGDGEYINLIY
jgi:hypothetical protein